MRRKTARPLVNSLGIMETLMLAGVLGQPIAFAVLIVVGGSAVYLGSLASGRLLTKTALSCGLAGVLVVALMVAVIAAYVSPDQSRQLGIAEQNYWSVLLRETLAVSVVVGYFSVLGASLISIPVVVALAKRHQATALRFMLLSLIISVTLILALMLVLHGPNDSPPATLISAFLIFMHTLLALGFAVGSGLPWRQELHNEA